MNMMHGMQFNMRTMSMTMSLMPLYSPRGVVPSATVQIDYVGTVVCSACGPGSGVKICPFSG